MVSFLPFPLEVREMIYELALVVGNVFPYIGSINVPNVNLLQTCRTIHMAAFPFLYSKEHVCAQLISSPPSNSLPLFYTHAYASLW